MSNSTFLKNHSNSSQYVRANELIFDFNSFTTIIKTSGYRLLFNINNNNKVYCGQRTIWTQIVTAPSFLVSSVFGQESVSKDIEHCNILIGLIMGIIIGIIVF